MQVTESTTGGTTPIGTLVRTAAALSLIAPAIAVLVLTQDVNPRRNTFVEINYYPAGVHSDTLPHVSITVYVNIPITTELTGIRSTTIGYDDMDPEPSERIFVVLPNEFDGFAAQQFQRAEVGKDYGRWKRHTNTCMTHVIRVLKAGGYPVPDEALNNYEAAQKFLESLIP